MYVVVTGPPASGKSTLARALAVELGLPLIAKDTVKSGLVEELGAADVEESRRLGAAAVRALLAVARENDGGVLDSVWVDRTRALTELADLPAPVVEVFCSCNRALLEERYAARAASRGPGHFDAERGADELWNDSSLAPLGGPWPVIEVDTSRPVDLYAVVERVLVDGIAAKQGIDLGPRPLEPVDTLIDLHILDGFARRWTTTLLESGHLPEPFAVVLTLTGVPELVAPTTWLAGPPSWSMGWGDPDELMWVRGALDRTDVRHRAHAVVTVDQEAGTIRVVAEHRADASTRDHTESYRAG
jgi:predicted kinase